MRRGGVYYLEHPEWGRRPVLVLTRDAAIPVLKRVAVATITRRIRDIPTEVVLDEEDRGPRLVDLPHDPEDCGHHERRQPLKPRAGSAVQAKGEHEGADPEGGPAKPRRRKKPGPASGRHPSKR